MIPAGDSAPTPVPAGGMHLLAADTGVGEIDQYGVALALCGAVLLREELPGWECPEGCGCEALYCPGCVAEAVAQSAAALPIPIPGGEVGTAVPNSATGPGPEFASNAAEFGRNPSGFDPAE